MFDFILLLITYQLLYTLYNSVVVVYFLNTMMLSTIEVINIVKGSPNGPNTYLKCFKIRRNVKRLVIRIPGGNK